MNKKTTLIHLGIITGLGLAVGLAGWILFPKIPIISDSIGYFTIARNLLMGKGLVSSYPGATNAFIMGLPCPDLHMPGWPLLIAGFMWLTRTGPYSPNILDILLTLLSSVLVYFIVLFWSDERKALASSLIFLLLPWIISYEFTGLAEIALVFWVLLSLFFASIPNPRYIWASVLGSGFALLVAYLVRESALFFLPLVIALLRTRGLSFWRLALFASALLLGCFLSSYIYYSSYPGFRDVREILAWYDLFTKTKLPPIKSPITSIVTWGDVPHPSPGEILWNVLIIKPLRILSVILKRERYYIIIRLCLVIPMILAPLVVKPRSHKIGLAVSALILVGVVTLYHGHQFDTFMRITMASATVAVVFLIIWLKKSLTRWPLYALFMLSEVVLGLGMYRDYWNSLVSSERVGAQLAQDLNQILGSEPAVIGWSVYADYPLHLIKRPNDYAVLYYEATSDPDFITLRDKIGMDAFVSYSQSPDFISSGWREDTLVVDNEVMYLYRRPK